MLPAPNRLRSPKDIARVYKQGVYGAGANLFSVKALATGRPASRATVVVSKKIDKRAVVRNRLRRQLVEALRAHWETVRPGYDIVITVHNDFRDTASSDLARHLHTALSKARAATD
ncbi:MAG TPA: ribonuclease P protein component [Candidatus Saccharimonadia bacterium]